MAVLPRADPAPSPKPTVPDENFAPTLTAVTVILVTLVVITTVLRVYTRYARRQLGLDDYTIAVVCVLSVARMGIQIKQAEHGNGRHRIYVSEEDYIINNMLGWYTQVLLFISTALLKISICLLIRRIKQSKKLDIVLYIVMAGLVITNLGCVVILLAQCKPISKYWDGPKAEGVCWPTKIRIYAIYLTISYNLLTDLFCSLLPLVVIWKVQIPLKKKIAVWSLMNLGLLATGFGVARAASLGLKTDDLSWTYAFAALWSNFELFLGTIAANLALSRFIYLHFFRKPGTTTNNSYGANSKFSQSNKEYSQFDSSTVIAATTREPSINSKSSEIPLEPTQQRIKKTTEVSWHVEKSDK